MDPRFVSVEQLEAMTEEQRRESLAASIVRDPSTDPRVTGDPRVQAMLARARRRLEARIAGETPADR
jgi:hypothetical protein